MGFFSFSLRNILYYFTVLIMLFLMFMYGMTMFGLFTNSTEMMNSRYPGLKITLYTLATLWILSLIFSLIYNWYSPGEEKRKFPIAIAIMLLTTAILGAVTSLF